MEVHLWIDGVPKSSSTNETFNVFNPLSKKLVSVAASATLKDCRVSFVFSSSSSYEIHFI